MFSLIGGDAALDFLNTRPQRGGKDEEQLVTFAHLLRWARAAGIVDPEDDRLERYCDRAEGTAALAAACALREAFRTALAAIADDEPPTAELTRLINHALRARTGSMTLTGAWPAYHCSFSGPLETPDHLVAAIAERIATLLSNGRIDRVRRCRSGNCVLWFLDNTRNGSRLWCSMAGCGARAKAAAYYRRRRHADRQTDPNQVQGGAGDPLRPA
jgi:predicted RNA-binding Zn ribbon-like protein